MSLEKWLRSLKNGLQGRRRNSARGGRVVAGKQFPDSLQIEILENRTLLSSVTGKVLTAAIEDFTTAGTIQDKTDNSPTVDQLDLKGIDGNLVVTLSKVSGAAKTNIQISRTIGTAVTKATYVLKEGAGGVADFDVDSKSALENQFRVDASMSLANVPFIQLSFT